MQQEKSDFSPSVRQRANDLAQSACFSSGGSRPIASVHSARGCAPRYRTISYMLYTRLPTREREGTVVWLLRCLPRVSPIAIKSRRWIGKTKVSARSVDARMMTIQECVFRCIIVCIFSSRRSRNSKPRPYDERLYSKRARRCRLF